MKKLLIITLLTIISYASTLPTNSIVKVFTTASTPNYKYPWQTVKITQYIGSSAISELPTDRGVEEYEQ